MEKFDEAKVMMEKLEILKKEVKEELHKALQQYKDVFGVDYFRDNSPTKRTRKPIDPSTNPNPTPSANRGTPFSLEEVNQFLAQYKGDIKQVKIKGRREKGLLKLEEAYKANPAPEAMLTLLN